ncbi:MAG: mechanosensitive ion channel [Candidatus Binatia bacterium]
MRIRNSLSIAALLGALLLATHPAFAQPTPADAPSPGASLGADLGKGAEEVTARLKDLERSLADVSAVEALETEVTGYTHRTATHWHETSRQLARNLRTTALDSLTAYWQALHNDLQDVDARVRARIERREAELASLRSMHDAWTHMLETARAAHAPAAVIDHVESTIAAIDRTAPRLEQRRASLLVMQNAIARAFQHCADALARIADARTDALARVLTPQEPPLWRAVTDPAATSWSGAGFEADLGAKLDTIAVYLGAYRGRLVLSVLVILLLIVLLRWMSRRLAAATAHDDAAARPIAFRTPIASAVLVGLLVTVPLRVSPPYEFQQLMLVVLLGASAFVLRPMVSPRVRAGLLAACAVFAITLLVQLLEPAPRVEQLLLMLEMSAMAGLLLWGARQMQTVDDEPFLRTAMRSLAFVFVVGCGLSALAAALGYLDLADLLGVGLLIALLLAVGLLAVRVAIDDVVAVVLTHGPISRLRTVAQHRRAIERGLRSSFDLLILAVWAWIILGRFQVRQPLLDGVDAVLGATLRAGGLELPLGQVLAFVAVLAAVVVGTRLVVVLLEEDVFSRMTLPRGVPYALSTLTRYSLLLAGFLMALGALGLDLTRITVLVSALGLGLGFGLQQIMNNFVSGLILLFERPVQVGDSIQMDGLKGDVLRIGIRSSTVRTGQGAEVIVPNSKLIEEKVTNWTLSDRRRRCELDLSVAADDDVERVMRTVVEIAQHHPKVIATPAPEALLVRLGRKSNHYQLRFWTDGSGWARVCSDLAVELHRSLRGVRTLDPTAPPAPPAKR